MNNRIFILLTLLFVVANIGLFMQNSKLKQEVINSEYNLLKQKKLAKEFKLYKNRFSQCENFQTSLKNLPSKLNSNIQIKHLIITQNGAKMSCK